MRRALPAAVLAVAVASIAAAAWTIPRSSRFLEWRYRGSEDELLAGASAGGSIGRGAAIALLHLAIEATRDPDPDRRVRGVFILGDPIVVAELEPGERREAKRALCPLLGDQTRVKKDLRVCVVALGGLANLDPSFEPPDELRGPEADERCAAARARLEAELARE